MDYYLLLAQGFGIIAMILTVVRMIFKERTTLLIVGSASFWAWTIHCYMLGAWTCMAFNIVAGITSLIALLIDENISSKVIYWSLSIVACIFTVYISISWLDYLPMLAFICISIANYCMSTLNMRLWTFGAEPSWLIYNLYINSWGGILTSIFKTATILYGIWKHERTILNKWI